MLELTGPEGNPVRIEATKIRRIRAAIGDETRGGCTTFISAVVDNIVREAAAQVASLAKVELPALIELRLLNDGPVWLNARTIEGPLFITRWEKKENGAVSAVLLGGKRLYLKSTPEEVHGAISRAGATPLPIPPEDAGLISDLMGAARAWRNGETALER